MTRFRSSLAFLLALSAAVCSPAFAEPMSAAQYQAKLATYDAASAAAAVHYAATFDMMGGFEKTAARFAQTLGAQLKSKNPDLTDAQMQDFLATFQHVALVDNADVIDHAVVLALLDTMSKDELIALDQFYSTPLGAGILKKSPLLSERLGEARRLMPSEIVPRALEAAKAKLKAGGVDVKL